jgi:hypothetical protein
MLQLNTEDIQLVQNQINAAQAIATAEAGLNDALSRIRQSGNPNTNISSTSFNGGSYTVTGGSTITSIGTTAQGFTARVDANITVGTASPYIIRINKLCINNQ